AGRGRWPPSRGGRARGQRRQRPGGARGPSLLAVLDVAVGVDAAPNVPARGDARGARLRGIDDGVEDRVGHRFVECADVAKATEVELQALQLDAQLVAHHLDREVGEVRLAGERAVARELGNDELDDVVALRIRI